MNYSDIRYMHVERLGNDEVEDLLIGDVYVFPKIDGTNAVVWWDDKKKCVCAGSRNRELTEDNDNAGFCKWVNEQENLKAFFKDNPNIILYGEWLVPHTLKTYRDDAWRKFYVFDVGLKEDNKRSHYISYNLYKTVLECYGIEYLAPLAIVHNPTIERINELAKNNYFLMKEGCVGEGVVCKNYDYFNKYGRQTWGKLVLNEFKEKHNKRMGCPVINETLSVEDQIVNEYVTKALVDKEYDKIRNENNGWMSPFIPRLLNVVYYSLITEECWHFVKKFKNPKVDFGRLQKLTFARVKELREDLF